MAGQRNPQTASAAVCATTHRRGCTRVAEGASPRDTGTKARINPEGVERFVRPLWGRRNLLGDRDRGFHPRLPLLVPFEDG